MFIPFSRAEEKYGHDLKVGSTVTGYCDSFASFSWFGFIKFGLAGMIMGYLYRHANNHYFTAQLLYAYMLAPALHIISHGTHKMLVSSWAYFFMFCFPLLLFAKKQDQYGPEAVMENFG